MTLREFAESQNCGSGLANTTTGWVKNDLACMNGVWPESLMVLTFLAAELAKFARSAPTFKPCPMTINPVQVVHNLAKTVP